MSVRQGAPVVLRVVPRIRAKYDAAQTTGTNYRHWAQADALGADFAASPAVRATLRNRGRYEQANSPMTDGQLQTLAADLIGRGPTLLMNTGDNRIDSWIQTEWAKWAKAVKLAQKLRTCIECRCASGEPFIRRRTNPKLRTPVKLDLQILEPDQVADSDWGWQADPLRSDGIVFDQFDNPVEYHVLKQHPGSGYAEGLLGEYVRVPASEMLHLFKRRRPGQRRGTPQITSGLPLSADRRTYRQSVLDAARKAAEFGAVVLESSVPANVDDTTPSEDGAAWDVMEIVPGMMTQLPSGTKANQMKAEQPAQGYGEFDNRLISEGARPLNMPSNIARLDSSRHNYASGRLDHQSYDRVSDVDQQDIEDDLVDPIFEWWMQEAMLLSGYMYATTMATGLRHEWGWRQRPHVDPEKESRAQGNRLANQTTTFSAELAQDGEDLEAHFATLAKEQALRSRLGLDTAGIRFKRDMALALVRSGANVADIAALLEDLGIKVLPQSQRQQSPRPAVPNNGNGNGQSQAGGRLKEYANA